MFEAIIVRTIEKDKKYQIIDGFHRWKDQVERGSKEILVNDIGVISDEVAKKLTLLRENARVPLDMILTSKLLKDLATQDINIEELAKEVGFNKEKLIESLEVAKFDWNQFSHGSTEIQSPKKEQQVVEMQATEEDIKKIKDTIVTGMKEEGQELFTVRLLKVDRIIMTKEQKKILFDAIDKVIAENPDIKTPGRALELICGDFLAS